MSLISFNRLSTVADAMLLLQDVSPPTGTPERGSAAARALGVDVSGVALNGGRPAPDLNISLSIACSFAPVFAWHFMRARQMRPRQMRARAHTCANLFPWSRIFMRRRCLAQKVMTSAQLDINEYLFQQVIIFIAKCAISVSHTGQS